VDSRGISNMLRGYVSGYQEGRTNPRPEWKIVRKMPHRDHRLRPRPRHRIFKAMEVAIQKAKETGWAP
jgi:LDH2 family malate/lactate/ureidoglycolate dehydrogenase